jgi:hypothetical protein
MGPIALISRKPKGLSLDPVLEVMGATKSEQFNTRKWSGRQLVTSGVSPTNSFVGHLATPELYYIKIFTSLERTSPEPEPMRSDFLDNDTDNEDPDDEEDE